MTVYLVELKPDPDALQSPHRSPFCPGTTTPHPRPRRQPLCPEATAQLRPLEPQGSAFQSNRGVAHRFPRAGENGSG